MYKPYKNAPFRRIFTTSLKGFAFELVIVVLTTAILSKNKSYRIKINLKQVRYTDQKVSLRTITVLLLSRRCKWR